MHKHTALLAAVLALPAAAQNFPANDQWVPLRCATEVMTDKYRDESGATDDRDLVGDVTNPAGARASDGQYLYLRVRLDADPAPGGNIRPFAWGILLDTDSNLTNYEVLIQVDGNAKTVALHKNTSTTLPNDPADPPDTPPVKTWPYTANARSVTAAGSSFGGNSDFYLDMAVPWADLEPLGVKPATPVVAWAVTSTNSTVLNGDFACFDDATGSPKLSESAPSRTVLDPGADSDGDGFTDANEFANGTDPNNASSRPGGTPDARVLSGGGGCAAAPGLVALLALLALRRRRG
jgi:hypothetical protein